MESAIPKVYVHFHDCGDHAVIVLFCILTIQRSWILNGQQKKGDKNTSDPNRRFHFSDDD